MPPFIYQMKKLIYLFTLLPLLIGCGSTQHTDVDVLTPDPEPQNSGDNTPSVSPTDGDGDDSGDVTPDPDELLFKKDTLELFYDAMKGHNFTADDHVELKQTFYGNDYALINVVNEREIGVARFNNQGIFAFFENDNKEYQIHGMLTPNTELSIYDGFNNCTRLEYLPRYAWVKSVSSPKYSITNPSEEVRSLLEESAYAGSVDLQSLSSLTLSKDTTNKTLILSFTFRVSSGVSNYDVTISNIGKNTNVKVLNFITHTTVTPQTDWNVYQNEAFNRYNVWEKQPVPFYQGFSIGLYLFFREYSGFSICMIFDYCAAPSSVGAYAETLTDNGFLPTPRDNPTGERKFAKKIDESTALLATFRFISTSELDEINQIAFPNGYLQIVLSVGVPESEITLTTANEKLAHAGLVSLSGTGISLITFYDINLAIGNIADDEEYRTLYDSYNLPYDETPFTDYFELHLQVSQFTDASAIVDAFANQLIQNYDFVCSVDEFTSVSNLTALTFTLFKYDVNDKLDTAIYIDMFNLQGELNEYGGEVSITVEKYSETGKIIFGSLDNE